MSAGRCGILVLGGYGHFGTRISRALARQPGLAVTVAGRRRERAAAAIRGLAPHPSTTLASQGLDHASGALGDALARLAPGIVVHAAGPYQAQDYHVAEACIAQGCHYVDLADGRDFVNGIARLDGAARRRGVLILSGASTVPALSSVVVTDLVTDLKQVERIAITIAPGQRTPRGLATVAAVLSYCGRPFRGWRGGRAVTVYGWQHLHARRLPALGRRWLATCDVPDLDLLPRRFPQLDAVSCYAGLEVAPMALSIWALSWLARWRLVDNWARYARVLSRSADLFDAFGSDVGGMHVAVTGRDARGRLWHKDWHLVARRGHGPEIPATPAAIVAGKLARGELRRRGALPCVDCFSLDEFARAVAHLDIGWQSRVVAAGDSGRGKLYPVQR